MDLPKQSLVNSASQPAHSFQDPASPACVFPAQSGLSQKQVTSIRTIPKNLSLSHLDKIRISDRGVSWIKRVASQVSLSLPCHFSQPALIH